MKNALLIGGSGFVGQAVARRLVASGYSVTIPTRDQARTRKVPLLPEVNLVEADVFDEATLADLMIAQNLVINLVGILRGDMLRVHVELPGRIAGAAAAANGGAGMARFVHISALAAAPDAPSDYLRSKAAGEAAVRAAYPGVTIFRPSVIFGRGDAFLTLFANLQKLAPVVPLACPDARFQPVWVEDVAAAIMACLADPESRGKIYPLGGPRVYTLRELVAMAGRLSGHPRPIIGLPMFLSYIQALLMECLPAGLGPMTRDNLCSMQVPNVCPESVSLPFGLVAASLEDVAPGYLSTR